MENRSSLPDEAPLCYLKSLGPLNLGVVHAVKLFSGLAETAPDADKTGQSLCLRLFLSCRALSFLLLGDVQEDLYSTCQL